MFDECSELPKDVTMALLTILNPNKDNKNTFDYEGYSFEIDFKRVSLYLPLLNHKMYSMHLLIGLSVLIWRIIPMMI